MGIKAAYMVPHPPLIVPAVGRGGEEKIRETTASYERVAEDIARIAPDTIVILSPHSIMYADYFHISPGIEAEGDFGRFGAPQVSFREQYDTAFVRRLVGHLEEDGFPGGTRGERERALDHGTMVPLYFIRKAYSGGKIVRIGLSGLSLTDHYTLGTYIRKTAEELNRNTVIVASGDLSHKLQDYGPYGFDPAGPKYDRKIMEAAGKADFGGMLGFDEEFLDKAAECGHRSFVIMAGTFDGCDVNSEVLSHQDVTGVGYGLCIFRPDGPNEQRRFLKVLSDRVADQAEEASAYVRLARAAIEMYVRTRRRLIFPNDLNEQLLRDLPREATTERAGAFVSVHKNGTLRGCIGTISAVEDCIAEEIIGNAISAVSRDPRFDPVRGDELGLLEINVDILGKPEYIDGPEELDVKRYGVIVTCGMKRGLLLPDLEGVDTVEDQISIAMRKGGISPSDDYRLQRFEVVRYR
ncbi:MAG: AmmeMemoRadiSam system protein A [Lachnospiraceae bacterium]|nr:AmmeMemoRadiSam system protein A [Lachnospiraceae bacterium]